jgi:drug/metabolite transporter (DMT)-like permease
MHKTDVAMLCTVPALWGASYLFVRIGADDFGAVSLAAMRTTGAALLLTPLLVRQGDMRVMRKNWKMIALVGITNCAAPFVLLAFAALTIPATLASIFSATTPLFAALIARMWLKDRISVLHILGLVIGFAGVLWLAWDKASLTPDHDDMSTMCAMIAILSATLLSGFSANFSKRYLGNVAPLAVATGSQIASAIALTLPSVLLWPAVNPAAQAWGALGALVVLCTALGYLLYFRLIASVGPARTMTVYFMVPAFGALWATLFLGEDFTMSMAFGCAAILVGMALSTGIIPFWIRNARNTPKENNRARNRLSG